MLSLAKKISFKLPLNFLFQPHLNVNLYSESWSKLTLEEVDVESGLMEALAKLEEDEWPDDGEVEIPLDEEFIIFGLPTKYLEIQYNIDFLLTYTLRVPLSSMKIQF